MISYLTIIRPINLIIIIACILLTGLINNNLTFNLLPIILVITLIASFANIINDIIKLDLSYEPDSKMVYSDLGMILIADIVSKVTSSSLNRLSYNYYYKPLVMNNTFFNPKETIKYNIVPTEDDTYFRNKLLQGEVHDETAFLLGGVSGHAGLFSNSNDIAKLAKLFLNY